MNISATLLQVPVVEVTGSSDAPANERTRDVVREAVRKAIEEGVSSRPSLGRFSDLGEASLEDHGWVLVSPRRYCDLLVLLDAWDVAMSKEDQPVKNMPLVVAATIRGGTTIVVGDMLRDDVVLVGSRPMLSTTFARPAEDACREGGVVFSVDATPHHDGGWGWMEIG
jgi:hypothetical protein